MIMSILAHIHTGLLDFYFVSIINYMFYYPLTVLGKFFCNLIKKKNSKNKALCCYSNKSKVTDSGKFSSLSSSFKAWGFFQYFILFFQ